MARMGELSSKPDASTSRARPSLNPWIVIGLILLLVILFILIDLHIRRNIEGPDRQQENTQFEDQTGAHSQNSLRWV